MIFPWIFTGIALYLVFSDIDWTTLLKHVGEINIAWVCLTIIMASTSYLLRAFRWEYLFPEPCLSFQNSYRTLILGFFMNNVLPARAGEIVRAHLGSKLSGKSRTLVLATIASERLVDAITISLFFLVVAKGVGDSHLSDNLTLICMGFFAAGVCALVLIRSRSFAEKLSQKILERLPHKGLAYLSERFFHFLDGLSPLVDLRVLPKVAIWSLFIWTVELSSYKTMALAYGLDLPWPSVVLAFVVFNFATLIPAAPGGIGVIEAFGTLALVSVGIPKEQALTIILSIHLTQYLVIGIPGTIFTLTWRDKIKQIEQEIEQENSNQLQN